MARAPSLDYDIQEHWEAVIELNENEIVGERMRPVAFLGGEFERG